ncbi:MAG: response regulator [Magnetococcales bacterium]|nr:response regulator [Magnetococcales bacterium]
MAMLLCASIVSLIALQIFNQLERQKAFQEKAIIATKVSQNIFHLSILAGEFNTSKLDRIRQQWEVKLDELTHLVKLMGTMHSHVSHLVNAMAGHQKLLNEVFGRLVAAAGGGQDANQRTLIRRLTAELNTHARELLDLAERINHHLEGDSRQEMDQTIHYTQAGGLIFFLVMASLWLVITTRMVLPVQKVQKGLGRIALGDLDYRLDGFNRDEIGDIAEAINNMSAHLSTILTSRDNLQREMEERQRLEHRLRNKRAFLKNILHHSTDSAIVATDLNFLILYFNPMAEQVFHCSHLTVLGSHLQDVYTRANLRTDLFERALETVREEGVHVYEDSYVDDEISHIISIRISYVMDSEDTVIGYVLMTHDVTDARIAEENRQRNERRLSRLLELNRESINLDERALCSHALAIAVEATLSDVGYMLMLGEGARTDCMAIWEASASELCTPEGEDHFIRESELLGDPLQLRRLVIRNEYSGELICKGTPRRHFNVHRTMSVPVMMVDKQVMVFGVCSKKAPYCDFDAQQLQFVADELQKFLTRRRMEEATRQAQRQADAANKAKSEFLAIMSHEIRTPLNAILGMTEILGETELSEEQQTYMRTLSHSGVALLALINDILDLSKIESSQLELERTTFNLRKLVDELKEIFSFTATDKGLQFSVKIDEGVPEWVESDPTRIRQILLNLINNAMKFTELGEVRLWVESTTGNEVRFHVSDTGTGVSKDKQDQIFEPFTQEDASITRKHGGSGLGLAICRKLADLLGGEIGLQSEVGKGSTFSVTLPLTAVLMPEEVHVRQAGFSNDRVNEREADAAAWSELEILLAEDALENQWVIQNFLGKTGCRIDIAENGVLAVEMFKKGQYDVVLMDVLMPEMGGLEATEAIRTWERETNAKPTPIIALTAHAMKEVGEQILEAGCNMHLTKPVYKKQLIEAIEQVVFLES